MFEQFDRDGDNFISQSELKELILNIKFGKIPMDVNEAVKKMMRELDTSGDNLISEQEFVTGLSNLLINSTQSTQASQTSEDDVYQVSNSTTS